MNTNSRKFASVAGYGEFGFDIDYVQEKLIINIEIMEVWIDVIKEEINL